MNRWKPEMETFSDHLRPYCYSPEKCKILYIKQRHIIEASLFFFIQKQKAAMLDITHMLMLTAAWCLQVSLQQKCLI